MDGKELRLALNRFWRMKLSREFLEAILGDGLEVLDLQDQDECHAFIHLRFFCQTCGVSVCPEFSGSEYASLGWCKLAAVQARAEGWSIRPPGPDGTYDLAACCPGCAVKNLIVPLRNGL